MPKILFLHGFLGSPEDWNDVLSFLPEEYDCHTVDLSKTIPCVLEPTTIVVGYSMGGRIALELFPDQNKVLIGAHLGLKNEEERSKRLLQEKQWASKLLENPHQFVKDWYDQPLFSTLRENPPLYASILERRHKIDSSSHARLISQFGLSRQPLIEQTENALFLFGEYDEKYANLYRELPNARCVPYAGHAAHLENPKATAQFIQTFIEESLC